MAFNKQGLSTPATKGSRLWIYETDDDISDVETSGYFNAAAGSMNVGDTIIANMGDGKKIYNVDAVSSAGVVTVVAANAGGTDVTF